MISRQTAWVSDVWAENYEGNFYDPDGGSDFMNYIE